MFRGGFFPANRVLCSAISAIDIALWDIQGKALGVPVYQLLGGRVRDKVVCYPHAQVPGEGDDVAALVDNCQRLVGEGWRFVRWGLPQNGDLLEPTQAVRTALKQLSKCARPSATTSSCALTFIRAWNSRIRCACVGRANSTGRSSWKTRCGRSTRICITA